MCGIVGIVGHSHVNQGIYDALTVLQHRGQDAAGIVTCDGDRLYLRKDNGMVRDVFRTRHMRRLVGNMGIGHVRYPTAGSSSSAEAQPFYVNSPYGITLAHNGNLTNAEALAEHIFRADLRHIHTTSDSEVRLNVFAHELQSRGKLQPEPEDIFDAVAAVHQRVEGAYAVVAMITGYGILAFRDPHGIRPVCFGRKDGHGGRASVTGAVKLVAAGCHSDSVGFYFLGTDVTDKVGVGDDLPFWRLGLFDKENSAGAFDSFFRQAIATDAVRSSSAPFVAEAASPLGCIWAAEALFEGALVASIGTWSR